MSEEAQPVTEVQQLKQLLVANKPQQALAVMQDVHPGTNWVKDPVEIIKTTVEHLTPENFNFRPALYKACEDILRVIAESSEDNYVVLFEFLEVIETVKDDNVAVSAMKGLQACLMKPWDKPAQSLEWCLNSLHLYVECLPLSKEVYQCLDAEEEKLLEQDDEVRRILGFYFYLFLFYEPILQRAISSREQQRLVATEYDFGVTQINVLVCFIVQLFAQPFAIFDLSTYNENGEPNLTNSTTRECASKLIEHLVQLMPNPYKLIEYAEKQERWPLVQPSIADMVDDLPPITNIFRVKKKTPPLGLATLFYVLIAEDMMPPTAPMIHSPVYVFERGLYMVTELLSAEESSIQIKGIRLCTRLLNNLGTQQLDNQTLEMDVHIKLVDSLLVVLNTTQIQRNSEEGIKLLKNYICQFRTIRAQYFHIRRLLQTAENNKICGFVAILYKDLVAAEITATELNGEHQISSFCSGPEFRSMMLDYICVLPNGMQTDILQMKDLITTALNFLLFCAIRDCNNVTGFWDVWPELECQFMLQLRKGVDCSRAHYRLEKQRIQENKDQGMDMLDVNLLSSNDFVSLTKENKLQALSIGQNSFDLIEMSMSRLTEIIKAKKPKTNGDNCN